MITVVILVALVLWVIITAATAWLIVTDPRPVSPGRAAMLAVGLLTVGLLVGSLVEWGRGEVWLTAPAYLVGLCAAAIALGQLRDRFVNAHD
jgi:hypothetical protein